MPPGASRAIPTITTGSAPWNVSSDIGIHPRGDVVNVFVQIEMPALVQEQLEDARGVVFPQSQSLGIDAAIIACAEYVDVGTNADTGSAVIAVDRLVVRSHRCSQ